MKATMRNERAEMLEGQIRSWGHSNSQIGRWSPLPHRAIYRPFQRNTFGAFSSHAKGAARSDRLPFSFETPESARSNCSRARTASIVGVLLGSNRFHASSHHRLASSRVVVCRFGCIAQASIVPAMYPAPIFFRRPRRNFRTHGVQRSFPPWTTRASIQISPPSHSWRRVRLCSSPSCHCSGCEFMAEEVAAHDLAPR